MRSLLTSRGARRGRSDPSQADLFDRVYDAIQTALEALEQREDISYVLLWRLPDDRVPRLQTSLDLNRDEGWNAIRLSLPEAEWETIPLSPPPTESEFDLRAIQPAPPTVWEEDPAINNIAWYEFQKHNPDRNLSWRWDRAHALVRHDRYISRKRDDEQTSQALRFLRELMRKPQDTLSIQANFPELVEAHAIYADQESSRQEIEARILSRQEPEEIAKRLSVSPEVVEAYADLFFDVLDRLDAGIYVYKQILQPAWRRNTAEWLMMSAAYHGGAAVLETVLPLLRDNGRELDRMTSGSHVQSTFAERISLLMNTRQLPNDEATLKSLIKHCRDVIPNSGSSVEFVNLIGGFSQIVSPFDGKLIQTETLSPRKAI